MENKLGKFYAEAEHLLSRFLQEKSLTVPTDILHEAIKLNHSLMKLPFQSEDLNIDLSYNIWEFYQATLKGTAVTLEKKAHRYHIDRTNKKWASWDDWCREVIWWGNKKGAYLYGNMPVEPQLSGHY